MFTLPHGAFGQPGQPGLSLLITHLHNVQSLSFSYYKIRKINDFNKFIYSTLAPKTKFISTRGTLNIFTSRHKKSSGASRCPKWYIFISDPVPRAGHSAPTRTAARAWVNSWRWWFGVSEAGGRVSTTIQRSLKGGPQHQRLRCGSQLQSLQTTNGAERAKRVERGPGGGL